MKLKLRYYVIRVDVGSDADLAASLSASDIFSSLRASVQEVFGDAGWGRVASTLVVSAYWPARGRAVVRGPAHADVDVRAALALVRSVRKRPAALRVETASGSARALGLALARLDGPDDAGMRAGDGGAGDGGDGITDAALVAALEVDEDAV